MKKLVYTIMFLLLSVQLFAQTNNVEMADQLRSSGKIYVVVVCIVVILIGLLIYLFTIDKRLKKIEQSK